MLHFLFLLLLPTLLFFLHKSLSAAGGGGHLPPGPNLCRILTLKHQIEQNPRKLFTNLAKLYGPIFSFRAGVHLIVVASSAAAAKEIFSTQNLRFAARYLPAVNHSILRTTKTRLPAAIVVAESNAVWKIVRGLGHRSIFSAASVEAAAGIRAAKAAELVEFLGTQIKEEKAVFIEEIIFATFANIISTVLTSRNLFLVDKNGENVRTVINRLIEMAEKYSRFGLGDMLPFLRRFDFSTKIRGRVVFENAKSIWGDFVMERKLAMATQVEGCSKTMTRDFLDILLHEDLFADDGAIEYFLSEMLMGSTDSVTTITIWLLVEMIKNEEILQKVRKEITDQAVEAGNTISEPGLAQCEYLQACIKEALRLHTPSPVVVPRLASKASIINGYTIPKNTIVLINLWAIHTDPGMWEDPLMFKPDRFLNSPIAFKGGAIDGAHFEYMPFGGGSRTCPGSEICRKGVQLMTACLVHYFDWRVPDGNDRAVLERGEDQFWTILKKDEPLRLIPSLRGDCNNAELD
ncbi:(S)-N-methylcoclaurine 3'-hydroxylase isozyme 1-like [Andrographis paniculata]|uniref:(S)-N-methylcoclaurine 3'-hydroxylase isozyme 1-like n=1 Tax=Andrographis paniculata TaxID=175694 RepID=UPI0021E786E7|nr:(S)-N-methylcoclaurine 3'-hydroxylase isozyme 1-like [Andrographis paniculata]